MKIEFKFKCSRCGCERLEECITNVTQYTEVTSLESEGGDSVRCNYGDVTFDTGETDGIDHFRCRNCGLKLTVLIIHNDIFCKTGSCDVNSEEGLMVWLQEMSMLVTPTSAEPKESENDN